MKFGERVLLKQYKNGNKLWGVVTRCCKCEGTGKVIWSYANHVCFDCNGRGWYYSREREYTPEEQAKRDAAEAKRRAEWEKKQAEKAAEKARKEAERLAEIERNRGQFMGNVGDKIEMSVTLERTFNYETKCFNAPWKTDIVTGYVFKTDDGNTLVWKTTGSIARKVEVETWDDADLRGENGKFYAYKAPEEGARLTIKGTIKAHEEYNNVNQTILTRVKWVD
jgi:hypothetical protein